MNVEDIARQVQQWAAGERLVRRVYLFGSRARGDHRSDSDIDLAVLCRMDPEILRQCGGDYASARMFFWHDHQAPWLAQLAPRFSVPVDLQVLDRDTWRVVRPSVKREGIRLVSQGGGLGRPFVWFRFRPLQRAKAN